jgi:hypothetical protein
MSQIPDGGLDLFMAKTTNQGHKHNFYVHWLDAGWQGNTLMQAQPYNTDANMVCVPGNIEKLSDGTYKFWTEIENHGPNSTNFNLQVSSS